MTSIPAPPDLRPLTALRFGAAAWVALYAFWPSLDVAWTPNLVAKGYLGVELFFVLSGFILSHVYLAQAGDGRFRYGDFLWARIARVYPLHLATLVGVGALGLAAVAVGMSIDGNILSWPSLPANLLMLHAWGLAPDAGWNHSSWSISAEWFAYLAFPAFAFVAWRLRDRPVLAVVGAMALMIGLYAAFEALAGFSLTEATIRWGALRIVPCFAYGCALYLVHRRGGISHAGWVALACVAGMAAAGSLGAPDGLVVLFSGGLILALGSRSNARAGWLASRPAVYLGEISYAVYMVLVPWQLLAVNLAARVTGAEDKRLQLFVWLAVILALPVVAAIAYHLVEHPARRALRGLSERRQQRRRARDRAAQLA
jgi:peptidoglycan/LPS O-acetylase OafA/YrhL